MTARILLVDLETAPLKGWAWTKYDTNIIEIIEPFFILSFAYQWLEDDHVTVRGLCDYKGYKPGVSSDRDLMVDLHRLIDEADIVVAHNAAAFDIKKAYTRFLVNGLRPPSQFKVYDTLKEVKKYFKFDSNRLNDLCKLLDIGTKTQHTGFALWTACMAGDKAAWELMKEYNAQDVVLLKEIYLRLRPWGNHPDVNMYRDPGTKPETPACPSCGGHHVQRRGVAVARTRKYQRLNCQSCGQWFSGPLIKV